MNEFEERFLDLGLEELLSGVRPPSMSDRILNAWAIEALPPNPTGSTSPLSRHWHLGRILTMVASFLFCVGVFWTIFRASLFGTHQESVREAQELVEKLRSDNAQERQEAARKLKDMGKAAVPELEKASRDRDPEVSAHATLLLKVVTLRETFPPVLWKDLPGVEERLAMGGHAWAEVLLEEIRKYAEEGSSGQKARMKDRLNATAGPALREARTHEEKGAICLFLVNNIGLAKESRSSTVPELIKLLRDEQAYVRSLAASALAGLGAKESTSEILKLLGDEVGFVRLHAVEALARLGAKASAPELVKLLKDGDSEVRRVTLTALGNLGVRDAAPEIVKLLTDESAFNRKLAVQVLEQLGARETAPEIAKLLQGGELIDARRWTVKALGQFGAREAAPEIAKQLTDGDSWLRAWAAQSLGKLGAKETAPELLKLLADGEVQVRYSAASSLSRFGWREGVAVLLQDAETPGHSTSWEVGYVGLGNLNALRQPELWGRLGKTTLDRDLKGTFHEVAEALGRQAGLPVVSPVEGKPGQKYEIHALGDQGMSVLEGLERFISYDNKFEVILEPDRIRILPRGEALAFWLAWWREEGKNK